MKSISYRVVLICAVFGLALLLPEGARAGWELYDNFNSGTTFKEKNWITAVSSSENKITVDGKRAKLVLSDPSSGSYARLEFTDPASIKGVRAKIKVENYSGDFSARIVGYVAWTDERPHQIVAQGIQVRPKNASLRTFVEVDDNATKETSYTLFQNYFKNPISVIGSWFTMEATYPNRNTYTFSVMNQGKCTFTHTGGHLIEGGKTFLYIGIKSHDGTAIGTAYVDDVWVLK